MPSSVGWVRHAPKNASPSAGGKPDETLTHIDVRRSLVTSEFFLQPFVLFLSGSTPYSPDASLTCGWERKRGHVPLRFRLPAKAPWNVSTLTLCTSRKKWGDLPNLRCATGRVPCGTMWAPEPPTAATKCSGSASSPTKQNRNVRVTDNPSVAYGDSSLYTREPLC